MVGNCFYRVIFVLLSKRRGEFFVTLKLIVSNVCNVSAARGGAAGGRVGAP